MSRETSLASASSRSTQLGSFTSTSPRSGRGRQALPVRCHRQNVKVRRRPPGTHSRPAECHRIPQDGHRSRSVYHPYSADRQRHPVLPSTALSLWSHRKVQHAPVREALLSAGHRAQADEAEPSLDQWPSRTHEPHHQGCDRQTIPLRRPPAAPGAPRAVPGRIQSRTQTQSPERPHTPQLCLQDLVRTARTIQPKPVSPHAGTEHLNN